MRNLIEIFKIIMFCVESGSLVMEAEFKPSVLDDGRASSDSNYGGGQKGPKQNTGRQTRHQHSATALAAGPTRLVWRPAKTVRWINVATVS